MRIGIVVSWRKICRQRVDVLLRRRLGKIYGSVIEGEIYGTDLSTIMFSSFIQHLKSNIQNRKIPPLVPSIRKSGSRTDVRGGCTA